MPRLRLIDVSKSFHGEDRVVEALQGVSFDVYPEEFVTVIGPSGSGKSTIFNLITGLLEPDEGQIMLDGAELTDRTGYTAYMPQRDLLLPWRSILDNVVLPRIIEGNDPEDAEAEATSLLPRFGLENFADAYPETLSGGMRQRAALLRTVMSGRETLLLDEPFGALDALTRRSLQDWLLELQRELNRTILFITHDIEEAVYLADRVIVLSPRPGRVRTIIPVELPRPRRQHMITEPEFGSHAALLLDALGLNR